MKNRFPILGISVIGAFFLVLVTIASVKSFSLSPESLGLSAAVGHLAASEQPAVPASAVEDHSRPPAAPQPVETFADTAERGKNPLPPGASILSQPSSNRLRPEAPAVNSPIYLHVNYAVVEGYVVPESDLHLVLANGGTQTGEARMRSDSAGYYWTDLMQAGYFANVQAGDVLTVEVAGSPAAAVEVPDIAATVYPITDTIIGTISGVSLPASISVNSRGNNFNDTTDASGIFTVELGSQVDLLWDSWVQVGYEDGESDWALYYFQPQDGMVADAIYPSLSGISDPNTSVLAEVEHGGQVFSQEVETNWRDGFWQADFSEVDRFEPGDIVTATIKGTPIEAVLSELSAHFDLPNDRVIGDCPPSTPVTVYFTDRHGLPSQASYQSTTSDSGGVFTATFTTSDLDTLNETFAVLHETTRVDQRIQPRQLLGEVDWPRNLGYGYGEPSAQIMLTLQDSGATTLEQHSVEAAGNDGWFQVDFAEPFQPGYLMVFEGGGLDFTQELVELTAQADLDADIVFGRSPADDSAHVASQGGVFSTLYVDYTTANGSGDFQIDLSGVQDLYNGGWSDVNYPQDGDPDQPAWQTTALRSPMIGMNMRYNGIWGAVPAPNAPITLTLDKSGTLYEVYAQSDAYGTLEWAQFDLDIEPGDVLTMAIEGWSQAVTASDIQISVDTTLEQVSGVGPAESFVEVMVYDAWPNLRVPTDASGNFMADFSEITDIKNGNGVEVGYYDENWNYPHNSATVPYARANLAWDAVDGWFGDGVTVVYTVTDDVGAVKGGAENTTRSDGWLEGPWCGELTGDCDMIPGDHVIVKADSGFETSLDLIPIQGAIDVAADQISGLMQDAAFPAQGEFWCSPGYGPDSYGRRFEIEADGSYLIDLSGVYDLQVGDECEIWYIDSNGNQVGTNLYTLRMIVNYAHDWVEAATTPEDSVQVVVEGKAEINGSAGGDSWFRTHEHQEDWNPSPPDIEVGDAVTVTTGDGYSASVNPVGSIEGQVDAENNLFTGTLNAPFTVPLMVWCEVWVENGPPSVQIQDVDPDNGEFTCDFNGIWDLSTGEDVAVIYFQPDGMRVLNVFQAPYARANYIWNGVDGWFGSEVTVQYTVTNQTDDVKGVGSGQARPDGWMDGVSCDCDMLPGDQVEVVSDAGFHALLQPIPISAHLDEETEILSGQMSDGVFPASGYVEDWNHGRQSGERVAIDIDPDGYYSADFSAKIDVLPGDYLNVWVIDPNGNHLGREYVALRIEAVYADDDGVTIEGEADAAVDIRVTSGSGADFSGQVNENGHLWTGDDNENWVPAQPDIQAGDTVTATTADYEAVIDPLGEIEAVLDLKENTVSGTINAPAWSGSTLQMRCEIWVSGGASIQTTAEADNGAFSCDFDDAGWDLQFGETVAVYYYEMDGDAVIHSFIEEFNVYLPVIKR